MHNESLDNDDIIITERHNGAKLIFHRRALVRCLHFICLPNSPASRILSCQSRTDDDSCVHFSHGAIAASALLERKAKPEAEHRNVKNAKQHQPAVVVVVYITHNTHETHENVYTRPHIFLDGFCVGWRGGCLLALCVFGSRVPLLNRS